MSGALAAVDGYMLFLQYSKPTGSSVTVTGHVVHEIGRTGTIVVSNGAGALDTLRGGPGAAVGSRITAHVRKLADGSYAESCQSKLSTELHSDRAGGVGHPQRRVPVRRAQLDESSRPGAANQHRHAPRGLGLDVPPAGADDQTGHRPARGWLRTARRRTT